MKTIQSIVITDEKGKVIKQKAIRQKFKKGDRVMIGKLPRTMRFFASNCEAIVEHSYYEMGLAQGVYVPSGKNSYSLRILGDRPYSSAWYEESQLTLIK